MRYPAFWRSLALFAHAAVHMMAWGQLATDDDRVRFDREARDGAQGYPWLTEATARIGHRLTGSAQGAMAEAFADSVFRAVGVPRVRQFPFEAVSWSRGMVEVRFQQGDWSMPIATVALANTPVETEVHATLVDAGNGLRTDLERRGEAVHNKIVLMNLGLVAAPPGTANLHRSEKTALALQHGAAGVVFVNNVAGHVLLTGTASIDGTAIPIPAVCITEEDGALLRERLAQYEEPLKVFIRMRNTRSMTTAHNVVAEIPGSKWPEEVIVVGGHLDSWDLATGATDNGLGSFSILDLARCFVATDIRPERTLRFVLFMGEEQGLLGSRALVEHYAATDELAHVKCMVNMDMCGNPQGFGVGGPVEWSAWLQRACSTIRQIDSTAFAGRTTQEIWLHSDHQPFLLKGVPVMYPLSDLGRHVYGCYHSSCDDIHLVDPAAMVNNVRFIGALLMELARADDLPGHFTPEALRLRLQESGLEEPLRIGGDWPW